MTAPKTAGSLTAGLLARKGTASPAMRRQPVNGLGPRAVSMLDDLGWNDMGQDVVPTQSPVAAHIAAIQETLDRRKAERRTEIIESPPSPEPSPIVVAKAKAVHTAKIKTKAAPKSAPISSAKSAFTLRIDAERHLRLRLMSAVTNRSAQQLLTGALDALIAQHPEIDALAANPKLRQAKVPAEQQRDDDGMKDRT